MKSESKFLVIIVSLLVVVAAVWFLWKIIAYLLVALMLSFLLQPLVTKLHEPRTGKYFLSQALASALALVLFWMLFAVFISFVIPLITSELIALSATDTTKLIASLSAPLQEINVYLSRFHISLNTIGIDRILSEKAVQLVSVSNITSFFGSLTGILANIAVAFFAISFITFFFIKDEKMFYKTVLAFLPAGYEEELSRTLQSVNKLLKRYLLGMIADMTVILILISAGMMILGIPFRSAFMMGFAGALLNIIPYVGPVISLVFGLIVAFLTNSGVDFYQVVLPLLSWVTGVYLLINVLDATLVQPFIYSSSVKAHPLEIFIVILTAGTLAGIPGMIVAIPSYTILRVVAKEFFTGFSFVKKLTKNI